MRTLKFPIGALKRMQIDNKSTIIENFYSSCDYERNNKNIFTKIVKSLGGFLPFCLISLLYWEKNKAINSHQRSRK